MVADDASMKRCATAYCARKMVALLIRETPELVRTYDHLWVRVRPLVLPIYSRCSKYRPICVVVLFYFLVGWIRSKTMILHLPRSNKAVNMTKVVIKILQGSAFTKTKQGSLITHPLAANF